MRRGMLPIDFGDRTSAVGPAWEQAWKRTWNRCWRTWKAAQSGIRVRMLGPLTISRDGIALQLPASRKVRALFAYLAMAPHPVGRSRLCELLWDVPNDPRGELRWCLSKLRGHPRRTRSPEGRHLGRHGLARSRRLPCRRRRGRGRGAAGNRQARPPTGWRPWPGCLPATSWTGWSSTAIRSSTAGSLHRDAASALAAPPCSSIWRQAFPSNRTRRFGTWRAGPSSPRSTHART